MERKELIKRVDNIDNDVLRIRDALRDIMQINYFECPDVYERMTIEAAMRSEQLACKFRHLIYATLLVRKPELMKKISEAHGIEIKYEDGIFNVTMPSLLPKKRKTASSEFIFDPLFFSLDRYFSDNYVKRFRECVVCFQHIYSEKAPKRRIRDYDNIELKQALDAISVFVMTDDGGAFCDVYHTTGYGVKDMTCVSIMNKNKFREWIKTI